MNTATHSVVVPFPQAAGFCASAEEEKPVSECPPVRCHMVEREKTTDREMGRAPLSGLYARLSRSFFGCYAHACTYRSDGL